MGLNWSEEGDPQPVPDPNYVQTEEYTSYSPFKFNEKSGKWEQDIKTKTTSRDNLKIVTFNVWFDALAKKERMAELLKISQDADIICLQEVTQGFLDYLVQLDWIRSGFWISDPVGNSVRPYGVMIISRVPVTKFTQFGLPTRMSRKFLVGHLIINNEEVQIGTIHLESLDSAALRRKQLEIIAKVLTSNTNLFMGDFNFDATFNYRKDDIPLENDCLQELFPQHVDIWATLCPDDKGYTFDPSINTMLRQIRSDRLDRIMMTSSTWEAKSIEILGRKNFMDIEGYKIFPSDHFGLMTSLVKK